MAGWLAPAATIASGLLGFMGQQDANDANQEAYEQSKPQPWDSASPYINQMMGDAQGLYNQQGFAPDPNELQLLGRQNELGYGEGLMPELIGSAQNAWQQQLDPSMNPYITQILNGAHNNLVQNYQRNVLPSIGDQAGSAGGYGGSRHGVAQGLASEGLLEAIGNQSAQMLGGAYNQSMQDRNQALNNSAGMVGLGLMPSAVQQDVGTQYQNDQNLAAQNLSGYQDAMNQWTGISGTPGAPANMSPMWGAAAGMANSGNMQNLLGNLGGMFGGGGLTASQQYGTVPGSQQTRMLANQWS